MARRFLLQSNILSLTLAIRQCYKLVVSSIERISSDLNGIAKAMQRRYFYVLFVPSSELSICLDTIRFLCEPTAKWRSHITVRGPYWKEIDVASLNAVLRGNLITLSGIDRFQGENQQTIYFRCSGTSLAKVWDKKDYGFNPHLTIYDGPSAGTANQIAAVVGQYRYDITFPADQLTPLTDPRDRLDFPSIWKHNATFLRRAIGYPVVYEDFLDNDLSRRLRLVGRLCEFLSSPSDVRTAGRQR